jgi:hypothetical protein
MPEAAREPLPSMPQDRADEIEQVVAHKSAIPEETLTRG